MSGPQGSEPTQHWDQSGGQQSDANQPVGDQPTAAAQAWPQPPTAYGPTAEPYPSYQPPSSEPSYTPPYQPPAADYPNTYGQPGQYGQQPDYSQQPGQYGQPGQYSQQPGQYGQQPGQYGQFSPYTSTSTPEGNKRSMALIGGIAGAIALVIIAVVGVLGFWKPGFFVTTQLDVSKAQQGVQQILTDETNGYGAKNVKDVKCNQGNSPTVKKGGTFDCEVSVDGTKRKVTVTFQDDNGTYEVGRPK